jgi:hypothetical protein
MHRLNEASIPTLWLTEAVLMFRKQKELADRAIVQVSDANLRRALDENTNSIAVIMKHMAGNMVSRWTDFLTSDGEKSWRNRDDEFVDDFSSEVKSREEILAMWERGWKSLFDTLESLKPDDLTRTVTIRGEAHTALRAIVRQIDHYGYHIGQIVMIARVLAGERWEVLSIPRGGSEEYNRRVWKK